MHIDSNLSKKPLVIVGMSGGVDSSVSALLLLKAGYRVEGLFMKNWEEDDDEAYCAAAEDLADAEAVCKRLDIKLHAVNFSAEYWDYVFEYFLEEYRSGRTPNPDIMCNKEIKFKAFLQYANHLGADFIATGHYCQKGQQGTKYSLLRGLDKNKDQSYFLYTLGQQQLEKVLFPIGHLEKPQVRKIAQDSGLSNFAKKDSTGICFIGERKFKDFLQRFLPAQPGQIVTIEGNLVGQHDGLMYHTLGQRKGMGIGGLKSSNEEPWYVVEKKLSENQLVVAQGHNHPALLKNHLDAEQLHWVNQPSEAQFKCTAKIRYRQQDSECHVTLDENGNVHVEFANPQRAVTPGQSIVFYRDEICLGGGIIQ